MKKVKKIYSVVDILGRLWRKVKQRSGMFGVFSCFHFFFLFLFSFASSLFRLLEKKANGTVRISEVECRSSARNEARLPLSERLHKEAGKFA
jgi:hypothetical protein